MNDFRGHVPADGAADDTGDSVVARQMNGRDEAIVDLDDSTHLTSLAARQVPTARTAPAEAATPINAGIDANAGANAGANINDRYAARYANDRYANNSPAARPRLDLPGLDNLPDLPGLGKGSAGATGTVGMVGSAGSAGMTGTAGSASSAGMTGTAGSASSAADLDDSTKQRTPSVRLVSPQSAVPQSAVPQSAVPQSAVPQSASASANPGSANRNSTVQLPRNIQAFLEDDEDEDLATKNQFTTVFDVLNQMETLVEDSKSSFFSGGQVRVDREQLTGLIEELKSKLPVQLERASALMRESERRLENAQSQANAIVASAQSRAATIVREANEQAQFLAGQENVLSIATERARNILDTAQTKADRLTQGADQYSASVLNELLNQLDKATHGVQSGLDVLAERQRQAAQQMPHLNEDDYPRQ